MRYGSQVKTTILRQVDPEKANSLEGAAQLGAIILGGLVCVFVVFLALSSGSFVPLWLFVTTLTLMVHMILLR